MIVLITKISLLSIGGQGNPFACAHFKTHSIKWISYYILQFRTKRETFNKAGRTKFKGKVIFVLLYFIITDEESNKLVKLGGKPKQKYLQNDSIIL